MYFVLLAECSLCIQSGYFQTSTLGLEVVHTFDCYSRMMLQKMKFEWCRLQWNICQYFEQMTHCGNSTPSLLYNYVNTYPVYASSYFFSWCMHIQTIFGKNSLMHFGEMKMIMNNKWPILARHRPKSFRLDAKSLWLDTLLDQNVSILIIMGAFWPETLPKWANICMVFIYQFW